MGRIKNIYLKLKLVKWGILIYFNVCGIILSFLISQLKSDIVFLIGGEIVILACTLILIIDSIYGMPDQINIVKKEKSIKGVLRKINGHYISEQALKSFGKQLRIQDSIDISKEILLNPVGTPLEVLEGQLKILNDLPYTSAYTGDLSDVIQKTYIEYGKVIDQMNLLKYKIKKMKTNNVKSELDILQKRIDDKKATAKEYEKLDYFLGAINKEGIILKVMKSKGIDSYKRYVEMRNKYVDNYSVGFVYGTIIGLLTLLKNKDSE